MLPSVAITEVAEDLEGSDFTHDPEATRYGIVQTEYNTFRAGVSKPQQSVELIAMAEVITIYSQGYWNTMKCGSLPDGVDFVLFQMGVNIGTRRAIGILQGIVGTGQDGIMGPATVAAAAKLNPAELIDELLNAQDAYYKKISNTNPVRNSQYLAGWLNRTTKVRVFLDTGMTTGTVGGLGGAVVVLLLAALFVRLA